MRFLKKILLVFSSFFIIFTISFFVLDFLYPLEIKLPKESQILYDIRSKIVRIKLNNEGNFLIKTDNIPDILKNSILYFEDRYFYYHIGVNPISVFRAFFYNLTHKNRIGASTITMQVARMLNKKERSYINKIIEIFTALQLEFYLSKDEILNLYFNLVPYGGNLQGVATASKFYFNKSLNALSYSEMALLSTIPKNPNKNRLDKVSDVKKLRNSVLEKLYKAEIIDKSEFKRAKNERFLNRRLKATYNAPEFSDIAFKNGVVNSHLDLEIQNFLLNSLKKAMTNLKAKNAHNAAAIVIDNQKMQVVAFIGSYDENSKNGKNNAFKMKRNVGSTLKPFIFSLALDNGLITPKKFLVDSEIYLSSYTPQNYLGNFLGIVSASNALTFSLNIPAVNLNQKLGENSLYELLKKVNLVDKNKEFYGASIALGSAELSLLNLTHLYTIYANEGYLKTLFVAGDEILGYKERLISKESAYLSAKILASASRAELKNAWEFAKNSPKIAFKTGTSYGSRDLYTVGLNKNYTIGVWIGNFNSERSNGLTGLKNASRVVFDMFKILSQREKMEFIEKPQGIVLKETCLDPFKFKECKMSQIDERILGVELDDICQKYRSEELYFMLFNQIITQDELKNSPCFEYLKNTKPLIASPSDKEKITTNSGKIMLKCYSFLGENIYLKIDDEPFFKSKSGVENFVNLSEDEHTISCLDESSNLSEIKIRIEK